MRSKSACVWAGESWVAWKDRAASIVREGIAGVKNDRPNATTGSRFFRFICLLRKKCTVGCPTCGGLINEALSCHQVAWLRSLRRLDNLRYIARRLSLFQGVATRHPDDADNLKFCRFFLFPKRQLQSFANRVFIDRKSTRLNSSHVRISYA